MGDRTTTNVLLAIIAGVLLFGQSAMTGALQVGAIVLAVGMVLAIAWGLLLSSISYAADGMRAAKTVEDKLATAAGLILIPFGGAFGLAVGWFWYQGDPKPVDAAFATPFGIAWMIVGGLMMTVYVGFLLWKGAQKMVDNRSQIPSKLADVGLYYLIALFAVIAFPIREWRYMRSAGSGITASAASAVFMAFIGSFVNLFAVGASALVVAILVGAIPLDTLLQ